MLISAHRFRRFQHPWRALLVPIALQLLACADSATQTQRDGGEGNEGDGGVGSLFVEVRTVQGALVEDAEVYTLPATKTAVTDESGTALLEDIELGTFRVSARHPRFGRATDAVQIKADKTASVHLVLDGFPSNEVFDAGSVEPAGRSGGGRAGSGGRPSTASGGRSGSAGRGGSAGGIAGGGAEPPGDYIAVDSQVETMLVDPQRPYLYALDRVNNSLHFVNLDDNTVESTIFVGSSPVDMDFSADGTELFIANFGSTEIAVVDLEERALGRSLFVDTSQGTWQGNPYRIAVTAFNTFVFTSEDQWNNLKLVNAANGGHITAVGSVYQPDLVASPDGSRLYVAESGSTGSTLIRFDVSETNLMQVDQSVTASGYGSRLAIMSGDGEYVFYAQQKYLASNLKSVLGEFGETIYASNGDGSVVYGQTNIFDGTMFNILRPLSVATTIMALSPDDETLYLYDTNTSRIYIEDVSEL